MATTEELEQFNHFAVHRLANGGSECSLEELLTQWRSAREREEANVGIRRGLADVEAGRTQSLDQFLSETRATRTS